MAKIWNCSHNTIILTTNVMHKMHGWGKKKSEEGGFVEVNKEQLELLKKSKSFQWMLERGQISFEKSGEPRPFRPHVHKRKPSHLDPKNIPGMTTKLEKMTLPEKPKKRAPKNIINVGNKEPVVTNVDNTDANK